MRRRFPGKETQKWKRDFLARAKPDLISQRESKTSVNSLLRRARSLFSPKITPQQASGDSTHVGASG